MSSEIRKSQFVNQFCVCGRFGDFCSYFGLSYVNLGVAGAPGAGVSPFSLYSNHHIGKGELDNPKGELDNPKDDL